MRLVLDWKKKLGYTRDPFERELSAPAHHFLVGLGPQQEKFNLFLIKGHQYGTITGEHGSGKTLFARWIAQALASGAYKALLLDGEKVAKPQQLADALLAGTSSFLTRQIVMKKPAEQRNEELFKILGRGKFVILIDNAGHLHKESVQLLSQVTQHAHVSVILIDTPERIKRLEVPLADQLQITTPKYTQDHLIDMLGKRIQLVGGIGTFPFDAEHLTTLVKRSEGSPAKLLMLARERAIELSLKVATPPKPATIALRTREPDAPAAPKRKLFAIKFERGEKQEGETSPFIAETAPVQHHEVVPEPSIEHHEDAAKLLEIMEQATSEPKESAKVERTSHDALVKGLAGVFEEKPKKGTKRKPKKRK